LKTYAHTEKGLKAIDKDIDAASTLYKKLSEESARLYKPVSKISDEKYQTERLNTLIEKKITMDKLRNECNERFFFLLGVLDACRSRRNAIRDRTNNEIDTILADSFSSLAAWNNPDWKEWSPDLANIKLPEFLRVGEYKGIPVGVPLMGHKADLAPVIVKASKEKRKLAINVLSCLVLRVALSLPKQSKFGLVDPEQHGSSFKMKSHLSDVRDMVNPSLEGALKAVMDDVRTVHDSVLDCEDSLEHVSPDMWRAHPFEFIFVADFASQKTTTSRVFEHLKDISKEGSRNAGRYLFMHLDTSAELPKGVDLSLFENAEIIDLNDDRGIVYDQLPSGAEMKRLLNVIKKQEVEVKATDFESLVGMNISNCWTESSKDYIETTVGNDLSVWFGQKEGKICAHGALAGSTGSGKSNFLHVLITGLALRYSPDELRMYLVDGKEGVEFGAYANGMLPHAKVVSLKTTPLLALSVIRDMLHQMEARYALFDQHSVKTIESYRKAFPEIAMPRLLLVADEYGNLFESDAEEGSKILATLTAKGRAAGIHILLCSQAFVASGMRKPADIFGNIHARISLPLAIGANVVEYFKSKSCQTINNFSAPGMVLINDNGGLDEASKHGMTALLDDDECKEIIAGLSEKAVSNKSLQEDILPKVFRGDDSPTFMESKTIKKLLAQSDWLSVHELGKLARQAPWDYGFSLPNWSSSQTPLALMIGRRFEVSGDFIFSMQRSINEHLLIVGRNTQKTVGVLSSAFVSMAAIHSVSNIEFLILDLIRPEMPAGGDLQALSRELLIPLGCSVSIENNEDKAASMIKRLADLVDERKGDSEVAKQPTMIAVISGLEDIDSIPSEVVRGRPDAQLDLQKVLRYGSQVGVHLIIQLSSFQQFSSLLDVNKDKKRFNHRISWQMSEDDSRQLMEGREAARLSDMADGDIAMYRNMQEGKSGIGYFRPYIIEHEEILAIHDILLGRVQ